MSRLQRSVKGFMRRVRMSQKIIFLVVEGRQLDAHFYGSLLESMPEIGLNDYETWVIDQISGLRHNSGKLGVLELHDRCRRSGALRQQNKSGKRSIVFCVDRDLDDATGRMRLSKHVLYTCHYNIETEVIVHGDDAVALARGLSLSPTEGRRFAAKLGNWPRELGTTWKEWLELCVIDAGLRTGAGASPARPSAINDGVYGSVSSTKQKATLSTIRQAAALADDSKERRLRARFRTIIQEGGPEVLLNGKHLPRFFESKAKSYFGNQPVPVAGCGGRILHCYLGTIDYDAPWAEHYKILLRSHVT